MAKMEQFRKWWEDSSDSVLDNYHNHFSTIEEFAEDVWKAALRWIKYAGVLTDLPEDLIDEELGNE